MSFLVCPLCDGSCVWCSRAVHSLAAAAATTAAAAAAAEQGVKSKAWFSSLSLLIIGQDGRTQVRFLLISFGVEKWAPAGWLALRATGFTPSTFFLLQQREELKSVLSPLSAYVCMNVHVRRSVERTVVARELVLA